MKHTETIRQTGKTAAAVAAALFAMSASNAETPARISSTLTEPTADISVLYTDTGTSASDIIHAPVEPGNADGITVTVNSLTVENQTTAGTVPGSGDRNGSGIASTAAFPGSSITLAVTKDITVHARTDAVLASGGSSVTGNVGGNLSIQSAGTGIRSDNAPLTMTVSGGSAEIVTDGTAVSNAGTEGFLTLQGAESTRIYSAAGHAVQTTGNELKIYGTPYEGDAGDTISRALPDKSGSILIENGSATESAVFESGSVSRRGEWISAGSVTVRNMSGATAIISESGGIGISASDTAGTGVLVLNNSERNPTIEVKRAEGDEERVGSVTLNGLAKRFTVRNENPAGYAVIAKDRARFSILGRSPLPDVHIFGNLRTETYSSISIDMGNGEIRSDRIEILDGGSFGMDWMSGNSVLSALDGSKTMITVKNEGRADITPHGHTVINSDFILLPGDRAPADNIEKIDSSARLTMHENSVWNGNLTSQGHMNWLGFYLIGDAKLNGNLSSLEGGETALFIMDQGVMTGDILSDGTGRAPGSDDPTEYAAGFQGEIQANGILNGNVTARNSGKAALQFKTAATRLNGDLVSQSGGSINTEMAGVWNGASSIAGGTIDLKFTDPTAVWYMTRDSHLTSFTQNAGTVNFPKPMSADTFIGTTLTLDGNYTADGGTLNMSTVLEGDDSPHDKLVIRGDASGRATLVFTKVSGNGKSTDQGIKVVEVGGTSDAVFTKPDDNRLSAGAYLYSLKKIGNDRYLTSDRDLNAPVVMEEIVQPKPKDEDPALPPVPDTTDPVTPPRPETQPAPQPDVIPASSPDDVTRHTVKPELGSYAANMLAANTLFTMSLADRLGETRYSDALKSQKHSGNVWIRTAGGKNRSSMQDRQLTNRGTWGLVQVGGDVVSWAGAGDHRFHAGLMMGYAHQNTKTRSTDLSLTSKGKVSGYAAGLYATYMNAEPAGTGPYVDTWLLWQKFRNKITPAGAAEESYHSKGWTGSVEAGYTFGLSDWVSADGTRNAARLRLEAQVIRMGVRADQHLDAENFTVAGTGAGNIRTRVGFTLYHLFTNDKSGRAVKPFLGVSWYHDTKSFGVTYDGVKDRIESSRNFGEVKLGVEGKVSKNVNLWGAAAVQRGSDSFRNLGAFIGAKVLF